MTAINSPFRALIVPCLVPFTIRASRLALKPPLGFASLLFFIQEPFTPNQGKDDHVQSSRIDRSSQDHWH